MVRVFVKFLVEPDSFCLRPSALSSASSSRLMDGTRVVLRLLCSLTGLRFPFSFARSIRRVQIKNRFPATISVLIGTVRRSKVRYIGAVKLRSAKKDPEGSASCADKAAVLRPNECTRLSLAARARARALVASVWIERAIYREKSFQRLL